MTKLCSLRDILSVVTGRLLGEMDGIYDVMEVLLGDRPYSHQLVLYHDQCRQEILAQHPTLPMEIDLKPTAGQTMSETVDLAPLIKIHGAALLLQPLKAPPSTGDVIGDFQRARGQAALKR